MASNYQKQDPSSDRYVNRRAEEEVIEANVDLYSEHQRSPEKFYEALQNGIIGIDETVEEPEFDFVIEAGYREPKEPDSFTYAGSINEILDQSSRITRLKMDSDQGYFQVETCRGEDWNLFIPLVDEESGDVLMQAESPWTGDSTALRFDRQLDAPEGFSTDVLNLSYDLAREVIPDPGIQVQGRNVDTLTSEVSAFQRIDAISRLENNGEATFDDHESLGKSGYQGRSIPIALHNFIGKLHDARVVDYSTAIFGNDQSKIEIDSGGYKKLTTEKEEPEEIIRQRLPESWK
jgi:hypothetical protein